MSIPSENPIFKLRGARDYLSATTVFDWAAESLPNSKDIDFQFHKFAGNHVRVCEQLAKSQVPVATYRTSQKTLHFVDTGRIIEDRYDCNEDQIVAAANYSEVTARFRFPLIENGTYSEHIVAIYKAMLHLKPEGRKGKLIFGRLKLEQVPCGGLCEIHHRRMIGSSFFESILLCNKKEIGALYFGQQ